MNTESKEQGIEKYLHLYIGCQVDFTRDGYHCPHSVTLTPEVLRCVFKGEVLVKPLLRPLPFIKRKEIAHLLWLVLDSPRLEQDCRISKEEAANSIDSIEPDDKAVVVNISLRCFEGKLYISEHSGNLRLYDDIDKELPIEWKPEIFRYLLLKRFDLFNLINRGFALDSTQSK